MDDKENKLEMSDYLKTGSDDPFRYFGPKPTAIRESIEKSDFWQTKDLYLAAAILALKYGTLESVDRSDLRHMKFYFSGAGLDEVQAAWTNRTLQVNAVEYANGIRQMKSIIHQND